jgi:hypothetical protein
MFDPERRAEKRQLRDQRKAERRRVAAASWDERGRVEHAQEEAEAASKQAKREVAAGTQRQEIETYGPLVSEGSFGLRSVKIYGKGFVKVAPLMFGKLATYERLVSIEFAGDVQKKTAPGRLGAAVLTGGANVLLTPNKRGDVYLTIVTDRTTHVLHEDPPNFLNIRTAKQLAATGQGVLKRLAVDAPEKEHGEVTTGSRSSQSVRSVTDRLKELTDLHAQGMITDGEYEDLRANLLKEL